MPVITTQKASVGLKRQHVSLPLTFLPLVMTGIKRWPVDVGLLSNQQETFDACYQHT